MAVDPEAPTRVRGDRQRRSDRGHQHQAPDAEADALARPAAGRGHDPDLGERHQGRLRPAVRRLRRGRRRGLRPLPRPPLRSVPQGQAPREALPARRSHARRLLPDRRRQRARSTASSPGSRPAGSASARTRTGPNPNSPNDTDDYINSFQYLPSIVRGSSGILAFPSDKQDPQPDAAGRPPDRPGQPAEAARRAPRSAPNGPIKHVFFIVKENRTYDQVLGDDPRGDGDPRPDPVRQADHPEPARAGQALPAARPRLRELRGLDRRPLLDRGRRGLRLRDQELAAELRRPRPPLRLRRLRGQRAAEGLHLRAHARRRTSRSSTTARRSPGSRRSPTRTEPPPRPPRTPRCCTNSDIQISARHRACYDSDIAIFTARSASSARRRLRLLAARRAPRPASHSRFDCFKHALPVAAADQLGAGASTTSSLPLDHTQGVTPGQAHPERRHRRQRLGRSARSSRRSPTRRSGTAR